MGDMIHLQNLRVYGYTGFLPEEQALGQWFAVDVCLKLSLEIAGQSDHIQDTLDYRSVIDQVKTTIETERFHLLERLTYVLVEKVLAFPLVQAVTLRVTKVAPPIPDFTGSISIELHRVKVQVQS
ncbi:dihydroneopterin aldolase [Gloeomargarita lithophora Alchichica-D10]|uniref:7,8-dihydroneopterin aldolase n=1 Tax=Gloeomargarita lithophora Alchichica-D10 TaxID=1188229 RepID=A0A1J0A924_9CYAN|nr:dihydroneopterin aldolase [Gloeomargarita lithophora]APB32440.1 dihydroneopterin aldolase [Gloeomargarita lithophora Alchichica-D10]